MILFNRMKHLSKQKLINFIRLNCLLVFVFSFLLLNSVYALTADTLGIMSNEESWSDETGAQFKFSDYSKSSVVFTMFYTECRKTCPELTLRKLKEIQERLDQKKQVAEFIIGTLDPENDTSEVLLKFKKRLGIKAEKWHLIRGTEDQTRRLAKKVGLGDYWKMDDHIQHGFRIHFLDLVSGTTKTLTYKDRDVARLFESK